MNQKLRKETVAVHGGSRKDDAFGAINEPIYMTSNYRIPTDGTPVDWSGIHSNIYCRNRNVNQMVLQDKLCALTGAEDCAIFASGVAALAAVFTTMLNSGDHAIVSEVCYSATNLLFREYLPKKYGVEVTLLDTTDTEAVRAAIRPNTKLIHVETPGNPTTGISDLDAIAEIAHAAGAKLSVDATFAGPICVYPLKHGADLEVHSMTKYINGHGDSLGGCVMGKTGAHRSNQGIGDGELRRYPQPLQRLAHRTGAGNSAPADEAAQCRGSCRGRVSGNLPGCSIRLVSRLKKPSAA